MVTLVNLAGASDPPICAPNRHPCSDSQSKPRVQPRTHRFLQMSKKRDLAQTAQNQPTQFRPKNRRGNGLKNEAVWWAEKLSSPGAKKAAVRSRGFGSKRRPWNTDKRSNKERAVNLEAVIKDDAEVLALYRAEMLGEEGGDGSNQHTRATGNNITSSKRITGTSRAYSIDVVQRKCDPETVAEVLA